MTALQKKKSRRGRACGIVGDGFSPGEIFGIKSLPADP